MCAVIDATVVRRDRQAGHLSMLLHLEFQLYTLSFLTLLFHLGAAALFFPDRRAVCQLQRRQF